MIFNQCCNGQILEWWNGAINKYSCEIVKLWNVVMVLYFYVVMVIWRYGVRSILLGQRNATLHVIYFFRHLENTRISDQDSSWKFYWIINSIVPIS